MALMVLHGVTGGMKIGLSTASACAGDHGLDLTMTHDRTGSLIAPACAGGVWLDLMMGPLIAPS
jgi:hypothetical protein